MTNSKYIYIIFAIIALLFCTSAASQDLPKMPVDKAVVSGVLPNGTNYYVVANSDTRGMADFALVQKSGSTFADKVPTSEISDRLLSSLPALDSLSPRKFFRRNGVVPNDGRFMSSKNDAAIFRFGNIALAGNASMLDSTLLVLMGMVQSTVDFEDEFIRSCYAPSECAIIVSGDVKAADVVEKIKMLSYMIPTQKSVERGEYQWSDKETSFKVIPSKGATSEIKVSWKMAATPTQYLGTIQPAVHAKLINELGYIASDRIKRAFESKNLAIGKVKYGHYSTSVTGSDEEFWMSFVVGADACVEAVATISEVLSSISLEGVSVAEQNRAHNCFMHKMFNKTTRSVRKDSEYVDMCINAFLNGAVPMPQSQLYDFYASKEVSESVEVSMLNRMASSVMTIDKNLEVVCRVGVAADSLESAFISSWGKPSVVAPATDIHVSDTLLNLASTHKLPVTMIRNEHLSGGHLWTFANGVRVAYKRMDTGGKVYWALGLNGGYGNIKDLSKGEGAFVGDMLRLNKVAGMPWDDFVHYLEGQGVYLEAKVGLYTTILKGTAYNDGLPMLMRSLKAIAAEREFDESAFAAYMRGEWLRQEESIASSNVVIDSLMCPGYKYSPIKTSGKLSRNLIPKAEKFYDKLFSKVNDGVIVIVGDQDESIIRKQLRECLGEFATEKSAPVRPLISYQPTSGSMTHITEGERNAVYMAMSIPMPLTLKNYVTSEVAGMLLNNYISSSLVGTGMYAKVYWDTRIAPHERFSVLVVLEDVEGLDKAGEEENARSAVRKVLSEQGVADIVDSQMKACKDWLKHNHSVRKNNPQYWVDAMLLRYLEGKDLTTGYDNEMDNVTAENVKSLLTSLSNASKVEYIIRKK